MNRTSVYIYYVDAHVQKIAVGTSHDIFSTSFEQTICYLTNLLYLIVIVD